AKPAVKMSPRSEMEFAVNSALMWFRRDLRIADNAALYQALRTAQRVYCVFVFDTVILDPLRPNGPAADRRVEFIHRSVEELAQRLTEARGALIVLHGVATEEIPRLASELAVDAVFANRDYEPDALARDAQVRDALAGQGQQFHTFKDLVIFEHDEIR